ncbi:hypothetical protein, partial [Sulfurimonas sp.]|uniref:hypothetical protein n=1 Tax=Sulfurimonas sp. TaxID=2022749 RepID=UPI003D09D6D3
RAVAGGQRQQDPMWRVRRPEKQGLTGAPAHYHSTFFELFKHFFQTDLNCNGSKYPFLSSKNSK